MSAKIGYDVLLNHCIINYIKMKIEKEKNS